MYITTLLWMPEKQDNETLFNRSPELVSKSPSPTIPSPIKLCTINWPTKIHGYPKTFTTVQRNKLVLLISSLIQ